MSEDTNRMLIHLPLDEIRNDTVINLQANSSSKLKSLIQSNGNLQMNYDYFMGSSIAFSGKEFIQKDGIKASTYNGVTIELWFNTKPYTNKNNSYFTLLNFTNNNTISDWSISINLQNDSLELYHNKKEEAVSTVTNIASNIETNKWIHLALTINTDGIMTNYINGISNSFMLPELLDYFKKNENYTFTIGKRNNGANDMFFFEGKMCQFKFYNYALSKDEITISMNKGLSANATFKSSYPIDFKLNSINEGSENPILYIENNNKGYELKLDILNVSGTDMFFYKNDSNDFILSEDQYHIQLRFKKQVLAANTIKTLDNQKTTWENNQWEYLIGSNDNYHEDWISIKRKTTITNQAPFSNIISLSFNNISASALTGARNTLVEIKYNNIYYLNNLLPLNGSLSRHLDIISHLGSKIPPFEVGIEGSNSILNDGISSNNFTIYVKNESPQGDLNFISKQGNITNYSKLALFFSHDNVCDNNTQAVFTNGEFATTPRTLLGRWYQSFECQKGVILKKETSFKIQITNFVTKYLSGKVKLYFEYQNIPGHWDGVIPIELQLSSLVEKNRKIGINTANPKSELEVKGNAEINGELTVKGNLKVAKRIKDQTGYIMPVGAIITYAGITPPEGWLLCDGQDISKEEYKNLRDILDKTTVPDLRNRFIVSTGDQYKIGNTGGSKEVQLNINEMPVHNHNLKIENTNLFKNVEEVEKVKFMHKNTYLRKNVGNMGADYSVYDAGGYNNEASELGNIINKEHSHNVEIYNTGGNASHENRPPYYALTYIIKY